MTNFYRDPSPLCMIPFAALLLTIAIAPLLLPQIWHRHHAKICASFAALTTFYYVFGLKSASRVVHAGLEYASFMVVVGAFFTVAGGVHLRVRGRGRPGHNTAFLFVGALLGNVLGTVGATMLLIRPWVALNRSRFAAFHTVFFIFVVSNIGGLLLPIGPPLLLGYVKGVPFWWVAQRCWQPWALTLGVVLIIFYVCDRLNYRGADSKIITTEKWRCGGGANFLAMLAMLVCLILAP